MIGIVCLCFQFLLASLALWGGLKIRRRNKKTQTIILAGTLLGLLVAQGLRIRIDISFKLLPLDYYRYFEYTSFVPFAIFFFAIASAHLSTRFAARATLFLCAIMFIYIGVYSIWIIMPPVQCKDTWLEDGVLLQSTGETCGPATLVTLLHAKGIQASEQEMADLVHTTKIWGSSMLSMGHALTEKTVGTPLRVDIRKLDWEGLKKAPKPCIVDTRLTHIINHVIVVFKIEKDHIEIGDPLSGRVTWEKKYFLKRWLGYALLLYTK